MKFTGIRKVFSTEDSQQYDTIGRFWEDMSKRYGIDRLRGLGFNWTENTIEYVIGLKEGIVENADCTVELPDENWTVVRGKLAELDKIYDRIYQDGRLTYEIEMFNEDGDCEIQYYR